jgi:hypothetical protein
MRIDTDQGIPLISVPAPCHAPWRKSGVLDEMLNKVDDI